MRKALIYLAAFSVSFIVIYSIYYYANVPRLSGGFVANADTLSRTIVRPHPYEGSMGKNVIYSAAMIAAMEHSGMDFQAGSKEVFRTIVDSNVFSWYSGPYSQAAVDKVSQDIQSKFPNHPPLKIQNVQPGQKMLFAYLFRNAELPAGFSDYTPGMDFKGEKVRAIRFGGTDKSGATLYMGRNNSVYVLKIPVDYNEEVYWLHTDSLQDVTDAWKTAQAIINSGHVHALTLEEEIIFPEIDIFLEKTYSPEEFHTFFSVPHPELKHIEDRIKVKLTAPASPFGNKRRAQPKQQFAFGPSSFCCIKRNKEQFPYFGMILHNADVLLAHGKR